MCARARVCRRHTSLFRRFRHIIPCRPIAISPSSMPPPPDDDDGAARDAPVASRATIADLGSAAAVLAERSLADDKRARHALKERGEKRLAKEGTVSANAEKAGVAMACAFRGVMGGHTAYVMHKKEHADGGTRKRKKEHAVLRMYADATEVKWVGGDKAYGLFARVDIPMDALITPYPGTWKASQGSSEYVIKPRRPKATVDEKKKPFLDAMAFAVEARDTEDTTDGGRRLIGCGQGHFANSSRDPYGKEKRRKSKAENAKQSAFRNANGEWCVWLKAKRKVKAGEEILLDYVHEEVVEQPAGAGGEL